MNTKGFVCIIYISPFIVGSGHIGRKCGDDKITEQVYVLFKARRSKLFNGVPDDFQSRTINQNFSLIDSTAGMCCTIDGLDVEILKIFNAGVGSPHA
ncbi:uncharacterized protein KGF55_003352 [Candida pseudojiufengensis]|uniref:uncharacterized protein n=1 Tax=Candida pseudojiufengensis TaxID=497109 RepID=UPI0022248141|nr:uncharacterized protein KGF55_003352 [Candida pseudojiufengensis]KAI5962276.1 hypothetical protein KGF55_003352 [Candida pseudojiufengensis]